MPENHLTLEDALARVRAASYDVRQPCQSCGGDGTVPGGRIMVHTRRGPFGADNLLSRVEEELATATSYRLAKGIFGDVLFVELSNAKLLVVDL